MEPTWVLSAPDGPHVGPTNLAIRDIHLKHNLKLKSVWISFVHKSISVGEISRDLSLNKMRFREAMGCIVPINISFYLAEFSWDSLESQRIFHLMDSQPKYFVCSVTPTSSSNRPNSQIPQCTCSISHNASFCNRNVHMCAYFGYKMVHCALFVWCVVGFVRWVYWFNWLDYHWSLITGRHGNDTIISQVSSSGGHEQNHLANG